MWDLALPLAKEIKNGALIEPCPVRAPCFTGPGAVPVALTAAGSYLLVVNPNTAARAPSSVLDLAVWQQQLPPYVAFAFGDDKDVTAVW